MVWVYDEPELLPRHLRGVELHEFTENVPREHYRHSGRCGALPAKAFRLEYPKGCHRERYHEGSHSAVLTSAQSMDRKARARGWRPMLCAIVVPKARAHACRENRNHDLQILSR